MYNYYIPKHKWEIVGALSIAYPQSKAKFIKMSKKQLYAIYFALRNKGG